MPQKSLQKPLSADQGQKPQKLLQRGLQKQPKKEVVDSAQYQESNPGSLDGQAYVAEDLDWLSNYMEDDVEEAEDAIVVGLDRKLAKHLSSEGLESMTLSYLHDVEHSNVILHGSRATPLNGYNNIELCQRHDSMSSVGAFSCCKIGM